MKRALICGGGGFLGWHLTNRLKADGYYVIAMDRKKPEFAPSTADEFLIWDLRTLKRDFYKFEKINEVYQLAAEVGGLGYIMNRDNDAEMLSNSVRINLNVLDACRYAHVGKVFFASSACVYPTLPPGGGYGPGFGSSPACRESDAYPAHPDNEYAWEKIFSERLYEAYARNYGMQVRIGRYHNCFGPYGTWRGGREKAPAAICRKVAEGTDTIEVWGDGSATRSFTYVDDTVEATVRLMRSDFQGPVNIGSSEMVTVNRLVDIVFECSGKFLIKKHIEGPVGVAGRNSDNSLIRAKLGWEPTISLRDGISRTYLWIARQVALTTARA